MITKQNIFELCAKFNELFPRLIKYNGQLKPYDNEDVSDFNEVKAEIEFVEGKIIDDYAREIIELCQGVLDELPAVAICKNAHERQGTGQGVSEFFVLPMPYFDIDEKQKTFFFDCELKLGSKLTISIKYK